ncbi:MULTISPECIES: VOC family protein [Chitinophaga]|uniref:VOC family protein n=1 Tax=Chitinophaga TaxID=79328 RepID=UPI000DB96528|nr:VOC family protein [Chitinophaga ginsengisegetis]MDR6568616.1 putative glyoxalase superfamily protein PhnB [Chitinophaga ginsengisegetis]MDR6648153.1 putative glyoxalase superfamily protein PhnB [Chitinophaga ginsengisegetis]MDR6654697.1 putative glyoxalase superfamily protein PhnB [Chitinophaga ginsengisegetis]
MKLPEKHQQVMPYLILQDAEGFFDFTGKVFGAKENHRSYREGTKELMHGEISIGGSVIMFGQSNPNWGTDNAGLFIYVEDADATFKKALAEGATEVMPVTKQSYGKSGGVKDPFGNTWWITTP